MNNCRPTIAQPCPESWAGMAPTATGRHCAACQKTVVDFTQKTTAEIQQYLAQPQPEGMCGRFRTGQLRPPAPRLLTWRAAPRLALSVAAVLVLTHCTTEEKPVPPATAARPVAGLEGQRVRGRVLDQQSRKPLAGALVVCEADTLCHTRTTADGSFELVVPLRLAATKLVAAMPLRYPNPEGAQAGEEPLAYFPQYFGTAAEAEVALRPVPMTVGEARILSEESISSPMTAYLARRQAAMGPPPIEVVDFQEPAGWHKKR